LNFSNSSAVGLKRIFR